MPLPTLPRLAPPRPVHRPSHPAARAASAAATAAPSKAQSFRATLISGTMVLIVIVGTIYGNAIGVGEDAKKAKQKSYEATPQEVLERLEIIRKRHARTAKELERKIEDIKQRIQDKERAEGRGDDGAK